MRSRAILLFLIVLLVLGGGVFFILKRTSPKTAPPNPSVTVETKPLTLLVAEAAISPILSFSGETVWFMTPAGQMFRKSIEGDKDKEEYPLPEALSNATRVLWPSDGADFIVEQNLNGHSRYTFFDARSRTYVAFPQGIRSPRFLPGGKKIVYDWAGDALHHELKIADANGNNFLKIADLFRPDYEILVSPKNPEAVLWSSNTATSSKLLLVDLFSGKFTDLGAAGGYEGVSFSPDGNKLLLSRLLPPDYAKTNLLWLDLATSQVHDLGLAANIEQTVWAADGKEVIAGSESGFQKYNLVTGEHKDLYQFAAAEKFSPRNLFFHTQQPFLFFVDEKTGYLYRLKMEK